MRRTFVLAAFVAALASSVGRAGAQDAPLPPPTPPPPAAETPPPPEETHAPPPPAPEKPEKRDEFETSWFGLRPEVWYEPTLSLQGKVGGLQGLTGTNLVPDSTRIDAHDNLGVLTHTPKPTYLDFGPGPIGLEMFVDTRWVSVSLWGVTPFEYHGRTTVNQSFTFGGFTFNVSRPIETDLAQALGGMDLKVNLLNNRFIRLSPVLAARVFAIDWTVQDVGQPPIPGAKISSEDVKLPLSVGRYRLFPYPEAGGEVRVGYRDIVEVDLKLTAMYVNYLGVQARSALFDGGVTGYVPFLPFFGVRVGFRYYYLDARTNDQQPSKGLDATLRLYGVTFSLIARF
jgi:hypothetical protein